MERQDTPHPSSSLTQLGCFHFRQTTVLVILRKLLSLRNDNASYSSKYVVFKPTNNYSKNSPNGHTKFVHVDI